MQEYINKKQVYTALKYKLISEEDLLEYLSKISPNDNHIIAYQHFLLHQREAKITCPQQKLPSGQHFFTSQQEEYVLLYALMGFSLDIPDLDKEVSTLLIPGTLKLYTDPDFANFINIITGQSKSYDNVVEAELAVAARQYTHLTSKDISFHFYITYDALDKLLSMIKKMSLSQHLLDNILLHCEEIQNSQPELWVHLIEEYTSFFRELYNRNAIIYIPEIHQRIIEIFPRLFPEEFQKFSPLAWKLYYLPVIKAGYYLGFPFHFTKPTHEDLIPALVQLSELGIDGYCDKFIQENKKFMEARIKIDNVWSLFKQYNIQFVNERDTLHEDVFGYSSYDLIILPDGEGRFFILTIPELASFIQGHKNFWTNKPLPEGFNGTVGHQIKERKEFNLPTSQPIRDLLKKLEASEQIIHRRDIEVPRRPSLDDMDEMTLLQSPLPSRGRGNLRRSHYSEDHN